MNTTTAQPQAAATGTATAEFSPTLNAPDLEALIRPFRQTLDSDAQAFDQARTDIEHAESTIERFTKAAATANAEALTFRDEIVELYRQGGTTKDAVKLKAKQRDALENAEIMASLITDGQIARTRAQLAASRAAADYVRHHHAAAIALEDHLTQTVIGTLPHNVWLLLDLIAGNARRGLSALYNARDDLFDPDSFARDRFAVLLAGGRPGNPPGLPVHTRIHVAPDGIARHLKTPLQYAALERELAALQTHADPGIHTSREVTP